MIKGLEALATPVRSRTGVASMPQPRSTSASGAAWAPPSSMGTRMP